MFVDIRDPHEAGQSRRAQVQFAAKMPLSPQHFVHCKTLQADDIRWSQRSVQRRGNWRKCCVHEIHGSNGKTALISSQLGQVKVDNNSNQRFICLFSYREEYFTFPRKMMPPSSSQTWMPSSKFSRKFFSQLLMRLPWKRVVLPRELSYGKIVPCWKWQWMNFKTWARERQADDIFN